MNRLKYSVLSLLVLVGCSSAQPTASATPTVDEALETIEPVVENNGIKVLTPSGAPSLATIPLFKNGYDVEVVDGPDKLQAAFVNPNHEYDVIIAPTNLGVKLASSDKTNYRLMGIVTWGNFYLVGNNENVMDDPNAKVGAFGEQAVSGIVFNKVYPQLASKAEWYASVSECAASLIAKKVDVALLAEPLATATIAKAKENGLELYMISNLQDSYAEGWTGFPQAGLFINDDKYRDNPTVYETILSEMKEYEDSISNNPELVIADIESIGAETLSVPNAQIISKVWPRMNINVENANEHLKELYDFLELFGIDQNGVDISLYSTVVD